VLRSVAGQQFYDTSPLNFRRLLDDPNHIPDKPRSYIGGFSDVARDVIERFDSNKQIAKLDRANLLYKVVARFADIDLHPEVVSERRQLVLPAVLRESSVATRRSEGSAQLLKARLTGQTTVNAAQTPDFRLEAALMEDLEHEHRARTG
jgi:type I restriction enzyme M protein